MHPGGASRRADTWPIGVTANASAARVLVVDDFAACCEALAAVARMAGFEVVGTACSGADGLRQLEALEPDLVLLDVRMPDLDGFETARLMHCARPGVVVVLLSATARGDDVLPKARVTPALLRELWRVRAPAAASHPLPMHGVERLGR